MGMYAWDPVGGFTTPVRTPRLSIRCEYPSDEGSPPSEVTFRLSPSYGLTTGHEVNEWFIEMMYWHEEFEVETDRAGELPLSFWSETVRRVVTTQSDGYRYVIRRIKNSAGPQHLVIECYLQKVGTRQGGEIMTRTIIFLMTLMVVLPSDGSSQDMPSRGDRIRVRQVDGTVLTGTLAAWSEETIQPSIGSTERMAEVPVEGIAVLQTRLGRQCRFGKYLGLTVATTSRGDQVIPEITPPTRAVVRPASAQSGPVAMHPITHNQTSAPLTTLHGVDRGCSSFAREFLLTRDLATIEVSNAQATVPGQLEGKAAADLEGLVGRGVLGFLGGFLIGVTGPDVIYVPLPVLFSVAVGATGVGAAAGMGSSDPPASIVLDLPTQGPEYTSAFLEAYSERLKTRRRRYALLSGLGGAVVGVVLHLLIHDPGP